MLLGADRGGEIAEHYRRTHANNSVAKASELAISARIRCTTVSETVLEGFTDTFGTWASPLERRCNLR